MPPGFSIIFMLEVVMDVEEVLLTTTGLSFDIMLGVVVLRI